MDYEKPKRQLSPLQQQRNQCVSAIMKGRVFTGDDAKQQRGRAFGQAVKECARKYPKQ